MRSIHISKLNTHPTTTTTITQYSCPISPWHSPIPYLFGGLAAIMGLIALALLALACSYWNHQYGAHNSDDLDNNNNNKEMGDDDPETKDPVKAHEERILVIMAGDHKPTFLACPMSHKDIHNHNHVLVPQENEGSRSSQHGQ